MGRGYGADVPFLRPPSTRPRRRPTSSGSGTRWSGSTRATTCSRSCAPRTRSAARRPSGAASSSCSPRPRRTRSAPSSSSSSTPGRCGCSRTTAARCGRSSTSRISTSPGTRASSRRCRRSTSRTARSRSRGRGSSRRPGRARARARAVPHRGLRGAQRRRRGGLAARRAAARGGRGLAACDCARAVSSGVVKVATLETLTCDAGWRPWIFVKATTDDGLVGWSEITDSHGSPRGLSGIVEDLSPLVVGRDPARRGADLLGSLPRDPAEPGLDRRRRSAGSRTRCSTSRPRRSASRSTSSSAARRARRSRSTGRTAGRRGPAAYEVTGTPKLASYDDVEALGREVVERGYGAFKTNIVVPGDEPRVLMPGFGSRRRNAQRRELARRARAPPRGVSSRHRRRARPIVDLNFNLEPEGCLHVAQALEPFDLLWLEVDCSTPARSASRRAPMPICSGENLYGARQFRPFLEAAGLDVASVDVIWNGFHQSKKIADLAETYEVNCAPHNYYWHLATFIGAQWCAAIPNVRILEIDVDDVPWREELVTAVPEMRKAELRIPPARAGAPTSSRTYCASTRGPRRERVATSPSGRPGRRRCGSGCRSTSPARRTSSVSTSSRSTRRTVRFRTSGHDGGRRDPRSSRSCRGARRRPRRGVVPRRARARRSDRSTGVHSTGSTTSSSRASSCSPTSPRTSTCTSRGSASSAPAPVRVRRSPRARGLLELEPFDLVFFLGVLYHSIHHLELLAMLNRVTKPGGTMLFETTVDPRPDAVLRLRWHPRVGQGEGRPVGSGRSRRASVDRLAEGDAVHGLPSGFERGALSLREDGRALRRRRSLGRREPHRLRRRRRHGGGRVHR